jgi:hypothetical protein
MHPGQYQALRDQQLPERPRLRNTKGASTYLREEWGVIRAPTTLAKLRVVGGGPEFRKIGSRDVGYPDPALDAYAESLISGPLRSTSEVA